MMWGAIKQNISFALRTLVKNPGFTITAVLTLALKTNANRGVSVEPLHLNFVTESTRRVLGLLLAAVGIYGVMAFGVAQRTREFGIRMALGAKRSRVVGLVLKEGTILAVLGAAIGLGGAYLVGRAMQSTLFGVGAFDATAFGGIFFLLLAVALLACLVPAWRASTVEPMTALRDE